MKSLLRLAAATALALAALTPAAAQQGKAKVDLELVLAVDISQSMDEDEHAIQKAGYVDAFRHDDVINALLAGPNGKIAVMYMEWAGDFAPWVAVDWTIIDSAAAARKFADRLDAEDVRGAQRTSISSALYAAGNYILDNDIASTRQVIDVSGDGANNAGPPVEEARDEVVKAGIVVNGLPIMLNKPKEYYDIDHLDRYYKHCVIGGPGSFIAPVFDLKHLAATIRKKLVMEIAGLEVEPDMAPIQFAETEEPATPDTGFTLQRAQLKLPTAKTDCFIGERVWGGGGGGGRGGFGRDPFPVR
jgi:hypothetical protein